MRKLVFSIALNGYEQGYRRCLVSQKHYARSIGADHAVVTKPRVDDPALAAWLKVSLLERALESGRDWVASSMPIAEWLRRPRISRSTSESGTSPSSWRGVDPDG